MFKKILTLFLAAALLFGLSGCMMPQAAMKSSEYDFSEPVQAVRVSQIACDVTFEVSRDGLCHVEIRDRSDVVNEAYVDGSGILTVTAEEEPLRMRFALPSPDDRRYVRISLPAGTLSFLDLSTVSGDIRIPEDFDVQGIVTAATVSGDMGISVPSCASLQLTSVSGDLSVTGTSCDFMKSGTTSGSLKANGVTVREELQIETISGDTDLTACSAGGVSFSSTSAELDLAKLDTGALAIETISGDISGTLARRLKISTDTVSGSIKVPSDGTEGSCTISTVSGDVSLRFDPD